MDQPQIVLFGVLRPGTSQMESYKYEVELAVFGKATYCSLPRCHLSFVEVRLTTVM